jgi:hypothetical protein
MFAQGQAVLALQVQQQQMHMLQRMHAQQIQQQMFMQQHLQSRMPAQRPGETHHVNAFTEKALGKGFM